MKRLSTFLCTLALLFGVVGVANAESAVIDRLALTGMTNWGPEYTLIERSSEVLSGGDIVSATYTASASYRDCFSYTDLDVSDYDVMEIVTSDVTGTWQICYKADGGGDRYLNGASTSTIIDLSGVTTLTEFHFRSDVKGPDGEKEPSAGNQSVIRIISVKLIKYGTVRLALTGMTNWGPEYTLIERSSEVLSGGDIVSATYTASASYRDCFSYTDLDVSKYEGLKVVTSDATGTWQICYKVDGGGDRYLNGASTIVDLSGVTTLTAFHFRSDTKGPDGENEPSAGNQSVIRIVNVSLLHKNEYREISVGTDGYASFGTNKPINVDGIVTAYGAKYDGSKIALTPVTEIPANTGVIIEASADTYTVPVIESASSIASVNDLLVSDGSVKGNGTSIYALGKKGGKVGFVLVKENSTIPAGKAYLDITAPGRDFIGFGDEDATGIEAVQQNAKADNQYFNIAGQRVAQPTKGLYIVNGKKVIIK